MANGKGGTKKNKDNQRKARLKEELETKIQEKDQLLRKISEAQNTLTKYEKFVEMLGDSNGRIIEKMNKSDSEFDSAVEAEIEHFRNQKNLYESTFQTEMDDEIKLHQKRMECLDTLKKMLKDKYKVVPLHLPPGDTSTERTLQIDDTNEVSSEGDTSTETTLQNDGTTEQIQIAKPANEVISEVSALDSSLGDTSTETTLQIDDTIGLIKIAKPANEVISEGTRSHAQLVEDLAGMKNQQEEFQKTLTAMFQQLLTMQQHFAAQRQEDEEKWRLYDGQIQTLAQQMQQLTSRDVVNPRMSPTPVVAEEDSKTKSEPDKWNYIPECLRCEADSDNEDDEEKDNLERVQKWGLKKWSADTVPKLEAKPSPAPTGILRKSSKIWGPFGTNVEGN